VANGASQSFRAALATRGAGGRLPGPRPAAPRGHLLEIGWARVLGTTITHAQASLIALPDGEQIPSAVSRITGISEHVMLAAVDGQRVWRELSEQAARLTQQPAPTVIHFARFEQPFLRTLATGVFPLDVVCTRDIARRLLPNLPQCSAPSLDTSVARTRPR
jgi:DNA polymerase III subunit epsilon